MDSSEGNRENAKGGKRSGQDARAPFKQSATTNRNNTYEISKTDLPLRDARRRSRHDRCFSGGLGHLATTSANERKSGEVFIASFVRSALFVFVISLVAITLRAQSPAPTPPYSDQAELSKMEEWVLSQGTEESIALLRREGKKKPGDTAQESALAGLGGGRNQDWLSALGAQIGMKTCTFVNATRMALKSYT